MFEPLPIPKRYHCDVHGDQGNYIGLEISVGAPHEQLPESLRTRDKRRYCWSCWVDMMDREMRQVTEVQGDDVRTERFTFG